MRSLFLILFFLMSDICLGYVIPKGHEIVRTEMGTLLINGRPAQEGEYPEIVYIRTGNSRCSATIVGSRVILTAAHCAATGSTSHFKFNGVDYSAEMTRYPGYPRPDVDVALGVVDREIFNLKYAAIGKKAEVGDKVILTGYGCIREGGGGGNDGILRIGESQVTKYRNYDFVTRLDESSVLCFGDSGGPSMYHILDAFKEDHYVIGVNSKGDIKTTSYLTRTDLPDAQRFFAEFASSNHVKICGINRDCATPKKPRSAWQRFWDWLFGRG